MTSQWSPIGDEMIHHALTALLHRHLFTLDDGHLWAVMEFGADRRVLMRREWDAPYYDMPGVAYHRWFDADVLSTARNV